MKPTLIRAVLDPDTKATPATIRVAIGLLGTLSSDVAKDLSEARKALGQRRRQRHDEILENAVIEAESIAYIARWVLSHCRAEISDDHLPVVITGLEEGEVATAPISNSTIGTIGT